VGNSANTAAPLSAQAQAELHRLLGVLSGRTGQLDSAIHHLDQAIRLAPAGVDSYLELGQVYQKQRQYMKAQQVYQQAMAAAPSDYRSFYQSGLVLKDNKDYLGSESMLRRAADLAPENVTIRRQLAAVVALNLVHNPRSVAN
jgi:tetratricopeptide (TPR) repeat protein